MLALVLELFVVDFFGSHKITDLLLGCLIQVHIDESIAMEREYLEGGIGKMFEGEILDFSFFQ